MVTLSISPSSFKLLSVVFVATNLILLSRVAMNGSSQQTSISQDLTRLGRQLSGNDDADLCKGIDYESEVIENQAKGKEPAKKANKYIGNIQGENYLDKYLTDENYTKKDLARDLAPYAVPFVALAVLGLFFWTGYFVCVCCPCCSCCRSNKTYTKCSKIFPAAGFILFGFVATVFAVIGVESGDHFERHIHQVECGMSNVANDVSDGYQEFIGTNEAYNILTSLSNDMNNMPQRVDEAFDTGSDKYQLEEDSKDIDKLLQLIYEDFTAEELKSNGKAPVSPLGTPTKPDNTPVDVSVSSIYPWGPVSDEATFTGIIQTEKHYRLGSLVEGMSGVRSAALTLKEQAEDNKDMYSGVQTEMGNMNNKVQDVKNSIVDNISKANKYLSKISLALLIFYGVMGGLFVCGIVGTILLGVCGVGIGRFMTHFSWIWLGFFFIVIAVLGGVFVTSSVVVHEGCESYVKATASEESMNEYKGLKNISQYLNVCLNGDGDLAATFDFGDSLDFAKDIEAAQDEIKASREQSFEIKQMCTISGTIPANEDICKNFDSIPAFEKLKDGIKNMVNFVASEQQSAHEILQQYGSKDQCGNGKAFDDDWQYAEAGCGDKTTLSPNDPNNESEAFCLLIPDWVTKPGAINTRYSGCTIPADTEFGSVSAAVTNYADNLNSFQGHIKVIMDELWKKLGKLSTTDPDPSYQQQVVTTSESVYGDQPGGLGAIDSFLGEVKDSLNQVNVILIPGLECSFLSVRSDQFHYALCQNFILTNWTLALASVIIVCCLIFALPFNLCIVKRLGKKSELPQYTRLLTNQA